MPAAHVQSKGSSSTGATSTTIAVTLDTNVVAGNLLAVFWSHNAADDFVSCADGLGNTFTLVDTVNSSGDIMKTFYAKNINGGACTVTVTTTAAHPYRNLVVHEINGADPNAPLDQHIINTQSAPGAGTDAVTSTAKTTTSDGQYIFGACRVQAVGVPKTLTQGTNFTDDVNIDGAADSTALESEHRIQTSAGSIAATFTSNDGVDPYATAMMTFKAAGSNELRRIVITRSS